MAQMAPVTQLDLGWCVMQSNRMNWLIALSVVALLGTAVVTLRAAERTTRATGAGAALAAAPGGTPGAAPGGDPTLPAGSAKQHPPASAPEELATIKDDLTTVPDPSQSADNNVSFPTDI